jgi:pilus assembly protein CpaC
LAEPAAELRVLHAGSRHLRLGQPIARVSVASTDIADVAAFPPDQLLITGKRVGQTTATVWSKTDEVTVYIIVVEYASDTMTSALAAALPDAKELKVSAAGTTLVVSGRVTDPAHVEQAEALLRGFHGSSDASLDAPPILNLLTVEGDYQVQLEVSFAEVSRTALKEIGLNFWQKGKGGDYAAGLLNPSSAQAGLSPNYGQEPGASALAPTGGLPVIATPLSGTFGMVFSTALDSAFPFAAALSVLSSHGYARTLSEPTLVAMSGQKATFLAGGEFPVPLPQSLGQIGIEYKKFGVQLSFVPTVVHDTIQLAMSTTVSDIDFGLGIRLAQVTVPGLTERHAETHVRLRDGQSFAIAGLLSDRVRSSVNKVPWLGDLPVLGVLFRSTSYRREETELLCVVTARIVRPRDQRPTLPGQDTVADPSDLELFFLGHGESKAHAETGPARPTKKPAGPVGFQR